MKELKDVVVFGKGGSMSEPHGVVLLLLDQGMHQSPLLDSLLIDTPYRRQGLATALINEAEEYCLDHDYKRIFAVTSPENEPAKALMKSCGFSPMILWEKKLP